MLADMYACQFVVLWRKRADTTQQHYGWRRDWAYNSYFLVWENSRKFCCHGTLCCCSAVWSYVSCLLLRPVVALCEIRAVKMCGACGLAHLLEICVVFGVRVICFSNMRPILQCKTSAEKSVCCVFWEGGIFFFKDNFIFFFLCDNLGVGG